MPVLGMAWAMESVLLAMDPLEDEVNRLKVAEGADEVEMGWVKTMEMGMAG